MTQRAIIALVDGEHHPAVVRDALDSLERERGVAGVVFCGGEEKVGAAVLADPEPPYGRPVEIGAARGARVREGPPRGGAGAAGGGGGRGRGFRRPRRADRPPAAQAAPRLA